MPGWVTDAAMLDHLQNALHQPAGVTAHYWESLAPKANVAAYRTILSILLKRGYSKAQIDAWPGGESYQYDLGVFWAVVKAGAKNPSDFDAELLKLLDRREELADEVITDASFVVINPGDGGFGFGRFDTSGDIFVHPDPDDPSLGDLMRF